MSVRARITLYILSAIGWVLLGVGIDVVFHDGDVSRAEQLVVFLISNFAVVTTLAALLATLVGTRETAYDLGRRVGRQEEKADAQLGRARMRVVRNIDSMTGN